MTTVMSPFEFDHLVQVVRHKVCGYRAECWCGWASAWCVDYDTADEAATDHRAVTAGPATALDATVAGLLDLQDDLADAVMWLAENWSSDLPVPQACSRAESRGGGDRIPCVSLLVHCATDAELVTLADLLACPVVLDPEFDRSGRPLQVATRCFGRVTIEAYTGVVEQHGTSPAGRARRRPEAR